MSVEKRKHEQFVSSEGTSSDALAMQQVILNTFILTTAKDQDSWVIENDDDIFQYYHDDDQGSYSASDFLPPAAK
jgi:hypothetical protein